MQKELNTADILIEKLNMSSHAEGGYFRRYYQSNQYITKEDKIGRASCRERVSFAV